MTTRKNASTAEFKEVLEIVRHLRGPEGCPWDRSQTHQTLMPHLLEEAYEVLEAIEDNDMASLQEELGDLLLQVLLHAQIGEESREFTLTKILQGLIDKLISRHPHVFADAVLETPEQAVMQWDDLKAQERQGGSALDGIAATLPALAQAQAQQRRTSRVGFNWCSKEEVMGKLNDDLSGLESAATSEEIGPKLGNALLVLCSLAHHLDVDAELALKRASRRFGKQFRALEEKLTGEGQTMSAVDHRKLQLFWRQFEE